MTHAIGLLMPPTSAAKIHKCTPVFSTEKYPDLRRLSCREWRGGRNPQQHRNSFHDTLRFNTKTSGKRLEQIQQSEAARLRTRCRFYGMCDGDVFVSSSLSSRLGTWDCCESTF